MNSSKFKLNKHIFKGEKDLLLQYSMKRPKRLTNTRHEKNVENLPIKYLLLCSSSLQKRQMNEIWL